MLVRHEQAPSSKFARKDDQHEHGSENCISTFLGTENWSRSKVHRLLDMACSRSRATRKTQLEAICGPKPGFRYPSIKTSKTRPRPLENKGVILAFFNVLDVLRPVFARGGEIGGAQRRLYVTRAGADDLRDIVAAKVRMT